ARPELQPRDDAQAPPAAAFEAPEEVGVRAGIGDARDAVRGDDVRLKQSRRLGVDHPIVLTHMAQLGRHLSWHGALAVDYFFEPTTHQPLYFEANPRLVDPMNAVLSGVNLADILVR